MPEDDLKSLLNPEKFEEEKSAFPDIDYYKIKKAHMIIKALNHVLRQKIIEIIYAKKRISVTEIYEILKLDQSVASQHLSILRKAGILTTERVGKYIFYSMNLARLNQINEFVNNLTQ